MIYAFFSQSNTTDLNMEHKNVLDTKYIVKLRIVVFKIIAVQISFHQKNKQYV